MNAMTTRSGRIGFWALLLLGIFAWAPAAYPGYWQALEGFTPLFNAAQPGVFATLAADADLWRGTGSTAFLLAQPLLMFGLPPAAAVRFLFALTLIVGGLSVYWWLQPRLGDRSAGLAGLIYMLLPPVLATVYVRGSLGDAWILALLPMGLAALAAFGQTRSPAAAGVGVITVLWMWRIQAGLALSATLLLLLYALTVERSRLGALVMAVSGLAGFISLVPLWSIQRTAPVDFYDHFVYAFQLVGSRWTTAPSIAGWQDQYPFQLGFVALALGVLSLWLWLSRARAARPPALDALLTFAAVSAAALILLSLTPSAFVWRITGAHRFLTYPWQILLLAMPSLAALAAAAPALLPQLAQAPFWPALVGLTLLASYPYLTADFTAYTPPDRPHAVFGLDNEIVVLEAHLEESADPRQARLDVIWQTRYPLELDYNIFFQAQDGDEGAIIAQIDAPPLGDQRPSTTWRPGEIMRASYELDLSAAGSGQELNTMDLRYLFGYYDWRTGARLPVDGGIDDKLVFYGR